jgi:hypothetical protein
MRVSLLSVHCRDPTEAVLRDSELLGHHGKVHPGGVFPRWPVEESAAHGSGVILSHGNECPPDRPLVPSKLGGYGRGIRQATGVRANVPGAPRPSGHVSGVNRRVIAGIPTFTGSDKLLLGRVAHVVKVADCAAALGVEMDFQYEGTKGHVVDSSF